MLTKRDIIILKKNRFLIRQNKILTKYNKELKDNVHETINFISELIKNRK